ncbi:hypothetical protein OO014_17830 [Intrasporangium calvum]|uniref:GlsB/YeaQ/YmgE family stress response membrane protein n=1 Tax=Intrasporangium calvum TaxID=53358 RepID=A0ABT5GLI8_9MICO|nr:hypothetical protein [Intrasporangium calvum]MDC5699113.1 hypothetical protein [Intrasporangium calvum]
MEDVLGVVLSILIGLIPAIVVAVLARRGGLANVPAVGAILGAIALGFLLVLVGDGIGLPADWLTYVIVALVAAAILWPVLGRRARSEVTDTTS